MAVGRISGPLLKNNLIRNGIDLAFETDLLYLDVNNQRIGIKNAAPQYELDVTGTTKTTDLIVTNQADLADITINGNTISTTNQYLNLATLDTVVSLNKIRIDSIDIEGNAITTNSSNADLEFRPNGTGSVNVHSNLNVDGNIYASGNITADGDINIGDANTDNVIFNAEVASDIIPDATNTYKLGSDPNAGGKEWNDVWVNRLIASSINSNELDLGGIDLAFTNGNTWYVAENGDDARFGDHVLDPFATIKYALSVAQPGDIIKISPGVYSEEFPLTVPAGVTVRGEGLRAVKIVPTPATAYNDAFLLNGDTTVEDITVADFYGATENTITLENVLNNPSAYGTSLNDYFGYSVDTDGVHTIVGAYQEDDAGGTFSGKAYIFDVATGNLVHTLDNPNAYNTSAGDYFAVTVAIDGNYAIVGAYQEDSAFGSSSGKAYIFDVTTGNLVHTLDNPNAYSTGTSDFFGRSVAISGSYAIVGAYGEDEPGGGSSSGKAYIFDVTTGSLIHTLDNPNAYGTSATDQFGISVAIDGNYAIVGAFAEDDAGGLSSGKAYIFNVTTGSLIHTLDNPNAYSTSGADYFGWSLAISGNYTVVGAYGEGDAGGSTSGKAYIFNVTTGSLIHTLDNPNAYSTSGSDYFGYSVAISGTTVVVGAYLEDEAGGASSGKAYVFSALSGQLLHTLDNPNAYSTSGGDRFGISVAISGNYAVVGAYTEGDAGGASSGKAYTYNLSGTTESGYAFRFAPGASITARSPYIRNVTVLTHGSATSSVDPLGFDAGNAGKGALVDGGVLDPSSKEAAMLFHAATFITPGVDCITATNGARIEWLNSFTYFANRSIYAYDGVSGKYGDGKTRIRLGNVTGTFAAGDTVTFTSTDASTVYTKVIEGTETSSVADSIILLIDGKDTDLVGFDSTPDSITSTSGGSALTLENVDVRSFGAEVRLIGSASVYGNYGLVGDGDGVLMYAIGHNMAYIGTGKEQQNDPVAVIQANEVVQDNGARIRYNSVDHKGDFRVGDLFYVNQETGNVTFAVSDFTINTENGVTFVTGGATTFIDGTKIETGDWRISGNTIQTLTQDANFEAASGEINLNSNVNVNGSLDVTGNVTIGGNITIGDEATDTIQIIAGIDSDITPKVDSTYTLGEVTKTWKNLYVNEIDLDSIVIRDNFIETTVSNADLELRANGTGRIYIPTNDVQIDNDLTVSGTTDLQDTNITGTLVHTGDYNQSGTISITGNFTVTQDLDVTGAAQFEEILVDDNYITTTTSNANLELRANGTGTILVPTNNVQIINDLAVGADITANNLTITGTITADSFTTGNIVINDNYVTTTLSNSDLELRANGTGTIYVPTNDVVLDQDLRVYGTTNIADTVISGDVNVTGNTTQTGNINLTGNFGITGNITISGTAQFENVNIDDNVIKTTLSNSDLELRATQYGDVVIPNNDVVISNDLYVDGTISVGDINSAGTITANRFTTGDILIDDNFITTTLSNSDLELRANGVGEVIIPSNDVILGQNLTVNGNTSLKDATIVGTITHIGDVNQVGNINLTGNLDVTGEVIISASVIQFEEIRITGNTIETTESNANLELRANDAGVILIPTNNVVIENNLTVNGTITVGNLSSTSTISANRFSTGDIIIDDNYITTTISNSNLELRTSGTGSIIIDTFDINGSTISSSSDITIQPGSNVININATGALKLPVGDTSERPTAVAGQIRFNSDLARFEGYNGTNWVNLKGVEDLDGNTKITAELTEGSNDNRIRFYVNGSSVVDIDSTRLAAPRIDVDDIRIDGNVISTTTLNTNLSLTANGTGSVRFDNFAFRGNVITNTVANSITTFENTNNGYVKFAGTYGIVIPVGASGDRPPLEFTELGQMRYNTTDQRVEIWDGSNWVSVAGSASGITRNDAEEIALATVLVLG